MRSGWLPRLGAAHVASLCALSVFALAASGCSWQRFDDETSNAPVVLLDKPGALNYGFGVTVATATANSNTVVLVGGGAGLSRAALYTLGDGEGPSTTTVDTGYCDTQPCYLSSSFAGFANAPGPDRERSLCFALGAGTRDSNDGILFRCLDSSEYALPIPAPAEAELALALGMARPDDFPLASDRAQHPSLLASSPSAGVAWFYAPESMTPTQLTAPADVPTDDASFGQTLAVLPMSEADGAGRVYAVGVPNQNEVLLWKSDSGVVSYIGCLGGIPGFGRALAGGRVNRDDAADLVISDSTNVHVIDGQALFDLPQTNSADCSFAALPPGALLDSFGCGTTTSLSDCEDSEFGAALAVGDLDGDGDGEVIVGAPSMTVRGQAQAGALLVYDAENSSDTALVDAKFISSAEPGDQLGRAITTPSIQGRDIILAGAPGNGKAALFYCSTLLPAGAGGFRCP